MLEVNRLWKGVDCRTGKKYCTRCVLGTGQGFERFCRECFGCAGLRGGANIAGGSPP